MKKNCIYGLSEEGFHNIAYTEWGGHTFELPSIICVHGYSRNGRDFDALAHYLERHGRHVFCPDVVGRGDSSWFKQSHHYNFNQYAADMNALIARTGSQQIDWIGTSMGGIIGMMLAALPNTPITRLILNDVGPQVPIDALRKLAKYIGDTTTFRDKAEAKEFFKKNYREFGIRTEEQWNAFTHNSIEQQADKFYVMRTDPNIKNPKSTVQILSDFFHHPHKSLEGILYDIDLWTVWRKIKCPVLVIRGVHSELLTPGIINRMLRTHNNTTIYEIEDAGHAPALLEEEQHEIINHWLQVTPHCK